MDATESDKGVYLMVSNISANQAKPYFSFSKNEASKIQSTNEKTAPGKDTVELSVGARAILAPPHMQAGAATKKLEQIMPKNATSSHTETTPNNETLQELTEPIAPETEQADEPAEETAQSKEATASAMKEVGNAGDGADNKLKAMRIAMRIAKGDNVPLKDHRFLAEYDSRLYKVSMEASLMAENRNPEDHESLVETDENQAAEQGVQDVESSEDATADTDSNEEIPTQAESIDMYQ